MRILFFSLISLTLAIPGRTQEIRPPQDYELQLHTVGRMILEHPEYKVRDSANTYFKELLSEAIATEKGFDHPFRAVTNMLRLADDEGLFRLFTWQMPDSTFRYVRYGMVVVKTKKGDYIVTELIDRIDEIPEAQFRYLKPKDWYGAIYYKMIPVGKGRKRVYTLLGYAPGQKLNRKIVDVIEVGRNGKIRFGAKVFKIDNFMDKVLRKPPMRLILSYNPDYAASVRWLDNEEMIVMDHLSPPNDKLKGVYQMYGPDFTYDGLVWDDGWWNLETGVLFNSGQENRIVPPSGPVGLPPNEKFRNKRPSADGKNN